MKIQTDVDKVLWRRVRVAALQTGRTVCEFVGVALDDLVNSLEGNLPLPTKSQMRKIKEEERENQGGALGQVATEKSGSTPPLPTKLTVAPAVNVVTPSGKYGKPLEDEPIATMKCWVCKDKVTKWTLDVKGHAWCDSCIQDQKNSIA